MHQVNEKELLVSAKIQRMKFRKQTMNEEWSKLDALREEQEMRAGEIERSKGYIVDMRREVES